MKYFGPGAMKRRVEETRILLRALDLWLRTEGLASSSNTLRSALRARKRLQAALERAGKAA
jgi:hypothetical protein